MFPRASGVGSPEGRNCGSLRSCWRRCRTRPAPLLPCATRGARGRPVQAVPRRHALGRSDDRLHAHDGRVDAQCAAAARAHDTSRPGQRDRGLSQPPCTARHRIYDLHSDPGLGPHLYDQPLSTSLPIMVPDSSFSCALRRFAALMGERVSLSVPRSFPESSHSATWLSKRCCSIMSEVLKRGRVNMSSQHMVALFERTTSIGSGFWLPTIATIAPCGATS